MEIKDVKRDGNCLLWAVIVSYLEQVKTNEEQFKKRYATLFGNKKGWKRIFNFTNFNFDDNKNQKLVKIFRKRICNYIKEHLDTQRPENKGNFRSILVDSEINKEIKELYPNHNQEQQITTTLEIMRKDGQITGSVEIEAICNILTCNIIRTNNSFEIANGEIFKPDYVKTNNEIKLQYANEHYKYFSNRSNIIMANNHQQAVQKTEEIFIKLDTEDLSSASNEEYLPPKQETIINTAITDVDAVKNDEDISLITKQNHEFLANARLIIKEQLLNKDIDEENHNAVIDIFIEDIGKASANNKNEILKKSIFELNNQDKLLANPNLVFEQFVTPIINNDKASIQQISKIYTNLKVN